MDAGSRRGRGLGENTSRLVLTAILGLAILGRALVSVPTATAATAGWVDTGGDCLNLRDAPGLASNSIFCLDHGAEITLLDGLQALDGFTWQQVTHEGQAGWVASFYVTTNPADVQTLREPTLPATAAGLAVPPEGGLTFGVATVTDPAELVAAQQYPVVGIWGLDIASQELRQYLPGAPAFVNTLSSIPAGTVVAARRGGTLSATGALPAASLTVAGMPNQLPMPPVGGITQGVSGTTDPKFLVQAQPFAVEGVFYFHVDSQQWLIYLAGAPEHVQSLRQGQLRVDSIVSLVRGTDDPNRATTPDPSSTTGVPFETSITYYYCVPGSNPAGVGDGGGYCGGMANGQTVHDGAAACSSDKLGQRFTIEGDPTNRTYTCKDTGGAVLQDHRDIWFADSDTGYAWWKEVGSHALITILPS